jgi:acyl CoA:acetate/3-ketoacid CoA transferase alpha subunit
MRTQATEIRRNLRTAHKIWGHLTKAMRRSLEELVVSHSLSVAGGDVQQIDGRWYVTHSGLLRLASRRGCRGIRVFHLPNLCDPTVGRWVFKAVVYKSPRSKGFVGYGDANPTNVSSLVHGAEMRVAETRAVNRALRKAYGIGLCSVEELGGSSRPSESRPSNGQPSLDSTCNGNHNGQPRLRDRLSLLIRQHRLDVALVKAYAADYCGTPSVREASREQIEAFINDLAQSAAKDRDGLLCKLNSYANPQEIRS